MNETPKGDIEVRQEVLLCTVRMKPPAPPPPPGFTSPFKTLEEWLLYLCKTDKPEKLIADLQFCLNESPAHHMLSVDGLNKYDMGENVIEYRIDYKPAHNYFPLPKEEYENLPQQQVRERILNELTEFMKTVEFRHSLLSKAESIKINFTGGGWQRLK